MFEETGDQKNRGLRRRPPSVRGINGVSPRKNGEKGSQRELQCEKPARGGEGGSQGNFP